VLAHAATCSNQMLHTSWRPRFDKFTRKNSMLVSDSRNKRAHLHPCDEPCPPQTAREIEDYEVDLASVKILELVIVPDIGGGNTYASPENLRLA